MTTPSEEKRGRPPRRQVDPETGTPRVFWNGGPLGPDGNPVPNSDELDAAPEDEDELDEDEDDLEDEERFLRCVTFWRSINSSLSFRSLILSLTIRRSVSISFSPGPRIPIPPCCLSRCVQSPLNLGNIYCI